MNDRSRRPASLRALLFLYSNANIGGCLSALLGPALLFGGVIGPGWMWITAGLYGVGALGGTLLRRTPEVERQIEATLTFDEILQHLDRVIAEVTPELKTQLNLAEDAKGVVITNVAEGSPAAEESLKPGDLIVEVGQEEVGSPPEIMAKVDQAKNEGKKSILLLVDRQGDLRFVALRFME